MHVVCVYVPNDIIALSLPGAWLVPAHVLQVSIYSVKIVTEFLSTHSLPGTLLIDGNKAVNKTNKGSFYDELTVLFC
jgi:hypothetical protein